MVSGLSCSRCAKALKGGRGQFYVVRIDAVADPTPPEITSEDLEKDAAREIARLTRELADKTEEELSDQVFKRKFICLCTPCYRSWIQDPAGSAGPAPRIEKGS